MSFTITAQAVPGVASAAWDVIDEHLYRTTGDWVILRRGLINLICSRVTREGDLVTRLEEVLVAQYYQAPPVRVSFLDVLELVRKELRTWPAEIRDLAERIFAANPTFPIGEPAFPLSFDQFRAAVAAPAPEQPPYRSMSLLRGTKMPKPEDFAPREWGAQ